jgi:hypothetical protein
MNRLFKFAAILLLIYPCACATAPSQSNLKNANYGREISQGEAESLVREFMTDWLKDPASAQYQWDSVYKGCLTGPIFSSNRYNYGYIVNAKINAKNSYGGYIGFTPYSFLVRDGEIVIGYEYGEYTQRIK